MTNGHPPWIEKVGHGWKLIIWAQPGAKKTECVGVHGDCLKIRVQAPAVDNKANSALTLFIAKTLGLKSHQVVIDSGNFGRKKNLILHTQEEPDWTLLSGGQ
jgi:uncharacterized protein (TIGR00251 family)